MVLQWDNARPHMKLYRPCGQSEGSAGQRSPNSPDLNMCDRFLFRKIKSGMKHSSFKGPENVEMAVRRAFDRIPESELMKELQKLKTRFDGVIEQSGVYLSDL